MGICSNNLGHLLLNTFPFCCSLYKKKKDDVSKLWKLYICCFKHLVMSFLGKKTTSYTQDIMCFMFLAAATPCLWDPLQKSPSLHLHFFSSVEPWKSNFPKPTEKKSASRVRLFHLFPIFVFPWIKLSFIQTSTVICFLLSYFSLMRGYCIRTMCILCTCKEKVKSITILYCW